MPSNAPQYPESLDPNVPGDGRPLQVGDIVWHTQDAPGHEHFAMVLALGSPSSEGQTQIQVRPAPGATARTFTNSYMGQWDNKVWQLMERPGAVCLANAPAYPVSLDPAVAGDGRPFQGNDIVRHTGDAQDGSMDAQITATHPNAAGQPTRISIQPLGRDSRHMRGVWWQKDFALVHRPRPNEWAYLPPAPLSAGMTGEFPSLEFCTDVAEYLQKCGGGTNSFVNPYADPLVEDPDEPAEGFHPSGSDAQLAISRFCTGVTMEVYPEEAAENAFVYYGTIQQARTPEQNALKLLQGLTKLFNTVQPAAGAIIRCEFCAAGGKTRLKDSAECSHYLCISCRQIRAGDDVCEICTKLWKDSNRMTDASHLEHKNSKFCKSTCCTHTVCACGCNTVGKKAEACTMCKHVGNHCKCLKCDVSSCMDKPFKTCCGGCARHCACASNCMRLSSKMIPLHKFTPPSDEKGMVRLLGTEVETAGSKNNTFSPRLREALKKWKGNVVRDGSVSGKGVEMVTQPAGGSLWKEMIADYGEGFKESKNFTSTQCGLHVHVDATDLDVWDLHKIIRLYAHIEQTLYDAITIARATSNYSVMCGRKYLGWLSNLESHFVPKSKLGKDVNLKVKHAQPEAAVGGASGYAPENLATAEKEMQFAQYGVVKPVVGTDWYDKENDRIIRVTQTTIPTITAKLQAQVEQLKKHKYDSSRYAGLNLHSFYFRGTLEFRHHHGTNDPEKIVNWGIFVGTIVDHCKNSTEEEIAQLLTLKPRLAVEMLLENAPETFAWLKGRWDKFTTAHGTRKAEPQADEMGEV